MNNLQEVNKRELQKYIDTIKSAPKGSEIIEANKHLLEGASSTWPGAGELSVYGFIWWKAYCELAITNLSNVKTVTFSTSGTGVMVGAFTSQLFGSFIVDPSTIPNGECHYSIAAADVGEGGCVLIISSTSGTLYGTFVGDTEGIAVVATSGTGKLVVS